MPGCVDEVCIPCHERVITAVEGEGTVEVVEEGEERFGVVDDAEGRMTESVVEESVDEGWGGEEGLVREGREGEGERGGRGEGVGDGGEGEERGAVEGGRAVEVLEEENEGFGIGRFDAETIGQVDAVDERGV